MDQSVHHMLERSARLDEQLTPLFEAVCQPTSQRAMLTLAMCKVAMEHWTSQRILIEAGYYTTATALVRLHFESVVRAIWLFHGAREEWISNFSAPVEPEQLAEPILGPSVASMLETINKTAPEFVGQMLGRLKAGAWQPMNSYVHGGVRPIVQALAGCTPHQLISVLRNANGLALMTGNIFVIALNDPTLAGRIRQIQVANMECLPPLRAS